MLRYKAEGDPILFQGPTKAFLQIRHRSNIMAQDIITFEKERRRVSCSTPKTASSVWNGISQDADGNIDPQLLRLLVGIYTPLAGDGVFDGDVGGS